MVLDGDDRPFASFLWPGNTADVTRLMPVVQRLHERFGIAHVCIVADRGMISAATIAALEKAGLAYILGVRERSTKEVRNEVIEDDGVAVPLVIPRQKGETQLAITETTLKGRRYVLCRNEEEARKDADRRAAILAGLDRKLAHGDKALVSNKGFRRFVKTIGSGNFSIDYDKAEADAKFDGLFVLRTNTKLSALQVVLRYRNLLAVEDTFKTTKALLTTRPIFHKTDAAIRGHIFCSFLAVLLRKELFDRLAARRHGDLEWQHIVDDLDELSEIEVEQDGRRALLRTAPGATIDPLCRALGITLPPVFQEIPPAPETSPIVWCLKRLMARKPLMHNYIYFETLEVGSKERPQNAPSRRDGRRVRSPPHRSLRDRRNTFRRAVQPENRQRQQGVSRFSRHGRDRAVVRSVLALIERLFVSGLVATQPHTRVTPTSPGNPPGQSMISNFILYPRGRR